ncbi:fungal zn binuclear cluster domain containing protein [Colletotrichum plurivorum]|uniref:Fungal zn binuclear cluster domain containing protein n=1 Tax=Colletotrichum plurivorum TaxID=2175906 RepID=A0A8H6KYU1_9PEZI|nr:fungal zn binuclear cluster domain containing protein [Colletotrichum plurivorum]
MTSVSSRGPTPHSPFASGNETDDSWQYLDFSYAPSSVGFLPSPASGSLNGYAIVGNVSAPDPAGLSPLNLDPDQGNFSAASFPDQTEAFTAPVPSSDGQFNDSEILTPHGYLFPQQLSVLGVASSPFDSFQDPNQSLSGLAAFSQQDLDVNLDFTLSNFQNSANPVPWSPTAGQVDNGSSFVMENFSSSPLAPVPPSSSSSGSNPNSPEIKQEGEKKSASSPIRKVMAGKVEKKKAAEPSKFLIVTPNSISARAGLPNLFECFENMRTNPRGRKGPLADATKQSALQVRRLGACFCCHSRKVKCDKERPCKNCKKLAVQVPQVICWQFSDFHTVLFPEFMRAHFRKDQMAAFMKENVDLDALEELAPRDVEVYSGLSPVLKVRAKFFQPRTEDVQQHYHLHIGKDTVGLQARGTAPMVLELDTAAQRDALRKKVKEYVAAISAEQGYAQRVTESIRHTDLPKRILDIVQDYANKTDSSIVKKALAIYSAHFVMTRHLCITRSSVVGLRDSGLVPQEVPWVTPRVLNRQIKAVIDELLMRDMQQLFESFSKSLKPKSRREWAPCTAAFLVLCLFMESVETAADTFVVALNEISIRNHSRPEYKRQDALSINKEVENLPFKQFAYQFHQIYQTHSRDTSAKPFNPLVDNSWTEDGDMDGPTVEMVMRLKAMTQGDGYIDLDLLTMDPLLPLENEEHPFPRDVGVNYTGRMVAKFLLSFLEEKYIFGEDAF